MASGFGNMVASSSQAPPPAVEDPLFWKDIGERLSAMVGAPLPTVPELNAMVPTDPSQVNAALKSTGYAKLPGLGSLGILAGIKAKNVDWEKLQQAIGLDMSGAHPNEIWQKTGWYKGFDGKWRFEISDLGSKLKSPQASVRASTGEAFEHPALYEAYPELKDVRARQDAATSTSGRRDPTTSATAPQGSIEVRAPTEDLTHSIYLHELQHAVQEKERFALGSSPEAHMRGDIEVADLPSFKAVSGILKKYGIKVEDPNPDIWIGHAGIYLLDAGASRAELEALDRMEGEYHRAAYQELRRAQETYKRVPGEAEARAVEWRRKMTPEERRATPPWESYDVPLDELIGRVQAGRK